MESIGGTVIQRSFIGESVGNIIHIATAPVAELDLDEADLVGAISEITGTPPMAVLSQEEYRYYLEQISVVAASAFPGATRSFLNPVTRFFRILYYTCHQTLHRSVQF